MSTLLEVKAELARIRRRLGPTAAHFSPSAQHAHDTEIARSLVDLIKVVERLATDIEVHLQANRALIYTHMSGDELDD